MWVYTNNKTCAPTATYYLGLAPANDAGVEGWVIEGTINAITLLSNKHYYSIYFQYVYETINYDQKISDIASHNEASFIQTVTMATACHPGDNAVLPIETERKKHGSTVRGCLLYIVTHRSTHQWDNCGQKL